MTLRHQSDKAIRTWLHERPRRYYVLPGQRWGPVVVSDYLRPVLLAVLAVGLTLWVLVR